MIGYLAYRFPDPADSDRIEQRWEPVLDRLDADRAGDVLVAGLRSSLRLFLAINAYHHSASKPAELLGRCATPEDLDEHLFGLLIPAAVAQHPRRGGGHYTAADVTRWLTTLTRHLSSQAADVTRWLTTLTRHLSSQAADGGRSATDLRLDVLWPAAGSRAPRYLGAALLTTAAAVPLALLDLPYRFLFGVNLRSLVLLVIGVAVVATVTLRASRRRVELQRLDFGALRTSSGRRRIAAAVLEVGVTFGVAVAVGSRSGS